MTTSCRRSVSDQLGAVSRTFGLTVVEELGDKVAALKPQSAFFERFGAAGIAALEEILAAARALIPPPRSAPYCKKAA